MSSSWRQLRYYLRAQVPNLNPVNWNLRISIGLSLKKLNFNPNQRNANF